MSEQISDHDLLVRIDERTAQHGEQIKQACAALTTCTTTLQDHSARITTIEKKTEQPNGNGNGKSGLVLALIKNSPWALVAIVGMVLLYMWATGTHVPPALLGAQ